MKNILYYIYQSVKTRNQRRRLYRLLDESASHPNGFRRVNWFAW